MVEALQRAVPGRFGLTADGSDVVIRCGGTVTSRIACLDGRWGTPGCAEWMVAAIRHLLHEIRTAVSEETTDRWESDVVYADGRVNVWFGQVTKDDAAFRWRDVLPLVASIPVVAHL